MPAKLLSLPRFHPYMAPGPNVSDIPFCPSASEAGADTVASSHHASSNDGSVDNGHWDPHHVFDYPGFDIYMGRGARPSSNTGDAQHLFPCTCVGGQQQHGPRLPSDWDAAMMVRKYHVVKSRLSIKKALLDYFSVVEAYPLAAIGPTEDYCTLARRRLYHEVMHAMEKALAAAEEIEYAVNPEKGDDQYEPNAK
ncbi:hypothetical protein PCANC_13988 [Puccinia coronata f. sp. avenae]|uniref:Uncharacterized protein n=1 Tax=Puccinia coronata f. sp. avenae TaxID=200324 RepID=A0A2N5UGY2_9BASI|nr:hypothetical protein PCANC_13988 [Puccinia coronata f. sp. avenae]